jgi:hypothetical protein
VPTYEGTETKWAMNEWSWIVPEGTQNKMNFSWMVSMQVLFWMVSMQVPGTRFTEDLSGQMSEKCEIPHN